MHRRSRKAPAAKRRHVKTPARQCRESLAKDASPGRDGTGKRYSVITVDWPEISNRLRQRMFLQAIMSSLRTMYDRNFAKRARSRSSARPDSWRFLVRTTQVTSYSAAWWQWGQFREAGFFSCFSSKKSRSSIRSASGFPGVASRLSMNYCTFDVAYDS